jgi:hypothetical protein
MVHGRSWSDLLAIPLVERGKRSKHPSRKWSIPERLGLARRLGAETIDYGDGSVHDQIVELTDGAGPDAVIQAVGMESMGSETRMERVKRSRTAA